MASPTRLSVVVLMFIAVSVSSLVSPASSASSSTCHAQINPFLHDLKLQCPITVLYYWPIEMDAESFDRVLSSNPSSAYVAILFYASWCPFSRNFYSKFAALSSMYPQINHIMLEQSSVPPIVFSRYGIHGVPSITIVNMTSRTRYCGPKDLPALLHFYQKVTGLEPVLNVTEDQTIPSEPKSRTPHPWTNIVAREPYLVFSALFVFLKALFYLYPDVVSNAVALWLAYVPRPNPAVFGESRQLFTRALHLVDVKRALDRLKLTKSRNFHNGARNARLWTSSLASFSMGKTFPARAAEGL